jgi:hypothetical protein
LTLGALKPSAKLQKEHTFGHGARRAYSATCGVERAIAPAPDPPVKKALTMQR